MSHLDLTDALLQWNVEHSTSDLVSEKRAKLARKIHDSTVDKNAASETTVEECKVSDVKAPESLAVNESEGANIGGIESAQGTV